MNEIALSDVQPRTLTDQVYNSLRERIIAQVIPPGTHLVVGQIARDLCVSLSPVREALRILESDGLVRMQPHRGAVTHVPSQEELAQLFVVRRHLESLAIQLACEQASRQDREALRQIMDQGTRTADTADFEAWLIADRDFHRFFADHCGNDVLRNMLMQLQNPIQIYRRVTQQKRPFFSDSVEGHVAICEAFQSGDCPKAVAAMTAHIDQSEAYGIGCFDPGTPEAAG